MRKAYTIEYIQKIAFKHKCICLSTEYKNNITKLLWKCEHGHTWLANINMMTKRSYWCPECHLKTPGRKYRLHSIEDMQELAKSKGGKCLSKKYINSNSKLKWQCKHGHTWMANSAQVLIGKWCFKCARGIKSIEDMQKLASNFGGKCLSKKYTNAKSKLKWQCEHGHKWMATPDSINHGSRCPKCFGTVKYTIQQIQKVGTKKGGECLSKEYINNNSLLLWKCGKGHKWKATASSIINAKSWCPKCSKVKYTIEDMVGWAKVRNGKCLSDTYRGIEVKLKWECKLGHVWLRTPKSVKRGMWCNICSEEERRREAQKENEVEHNTIIRDIKNKGVHYKKEAKLLKKKLKKKNIEFMKDAK